MSEAKKDMLFDMSEDMKNDALQQVNFFIKLYNITTLTL